MPQFTVDSEHVRIGRPVAYDDSRWFYDRRLQRLAVVLNIAGFIAEVSRVNL